MQRDHDHSRRALRGRITQELHLLVVALLLSAGPSAAGAQWDPRGQRTPGSDARSATNPAADGSIAPVVSVSEAPRDLTVADLVRLAGQLERAHEPARAVAHYERAVAAAPTSRLAMRARRRLSYLQARADGGFGPLVIMQRFRARDRAARSEEATLAFERAVRRFPSGRVRVESWPLVGEAWLALGAPARAEAAFRAMVEEAAATDSERIAAHTGIARAVAAQRGAAAGAAHLERLGLDQTATHASLSRTARQEVGLLAAWALIASFVLLVLATGRRELLRLAVLRRALSARRLAVAAYALGVPPWLAHRYDASALDTFLFLAVGGAVVLALASLAGEAMRERRARGAERIAVAAVAVAAHVAIGYLALDRAGQLLAFA